MADGHQQGDDEERQPADDESARDDGQRLGRFSLTSRLDVTSSVGVGRGRNGRRGAATGWCLFLRFIGQAIGAASFGAVLNATMMAIDPGAAGGVDRLLDPVRRAAMSQDEVAHLTGIVAQSLHNSYLLAGAFAVATLGISWLLPRGLSPRDHATRR